MSRDRLLPTVFSKIHTRFRTPAVATWVAGFVVGIPAGLLDIGTVSNLSNIGTLFAFVLVSIAVLILRYREPERPPRLSRAVRAGVPGAEHHLLHRADDGAGSADVDGLLHLAVRRAADLLLLQPPSLRVRARALSPHLIPTQGSSVDVILSASNSLRPCNFSPEVGSPLPRPKFHGILTNDFVEHALRFRNGTRLSSFPIISPDTNDPRTKTRRANRQDSKTSGIPSALKHACPL